MVVHLVLLVCVAQAAQNNAWKATVCWAHLATNSSRECPPPPSFQARVMLWRRRIDGLAFALARYRLFTCPPQVRLRLAGKGALPSHTCENVPSMRVEIAQHVACAGPYARHCSRVSGLTRWWVSRACITPRAQRCAWCSVQVIRSLIYEYLSVCRRFSFRTHQLVLVCPPQWHTSSQYRY